MRGYRVTVTLNDELRHTTGHSSDDCITEIIPPGTPVVMREFADAGTALYIAESWLYDNQAARVEIDEVFDDEDE